MLGRAFFRTFLLLTRYELDSPGVRPPLTDVFGHQLLLEPLVREGRLVGPLPPVATPSGHAHVAFIRPLLAGMVDADQKDQKTAPKDWKQKKGGFFFLTLG